MRQRGGSGYPPGGVPGQVPPGSGYPPGGVVPGQVPLPPGGPGTPRGGTRSGTPPGGYPVRYPPRGSRYPWGGTQSGTPQGGTQLGTPQGGSGYPPGGYLVRYPPGGPGTPRGVPSQVPPGGYLVWYHPPGGSGYPLGGYPVRYPPGGVRVPPRGGTQSGQQKEYSLHGGRYASCVHAGGLSCLCGGNILVSERGETMWLFSVKRLRRGIIGCVAITVCGCLLIWSISIPVHMLQKDNRKSVKSLSYNTCGNSSRRQSVIAYDVNYKQYNAILSPVNVSKTELDMIILVPSHYSVDAADRRKVIRKTCANKTYMYPLKMQHVFVLGRFTSRSKI